MIAFLYKTLCFKKHFRQILGKHPFTTQRQTEHTDTHTHTLDTVISSNSWNDRGLKNVQIVK